MAQPPPYVRVDNYSAFLPIQGPSLNAEFDRIKVTLDAVLVSLKLAQRDDGVLTNRSVSQDTVTADLLTMMAGWTPRGAWVTATEYFVGDFVSNAGINYVCNTHHISGVTFDASKFTVAGGGGTVTAGLNGQLAVYAADGPVVSGSTTLPAGAVTTTQAAGDSSTKFASTAFVTGAIATATGKIYPPQVFISSGTYTPRAGMVNCIIECWGGGGGGGGTANQAAANAQSGGGGGGAGSYSRFTATAAAIGASKAVTIGTAGTAGAVTPTAGGNGGDTSVGVLCVGKGGTGGGTAGAAGAGGVAGTGDVTTTGMSGSVNIILNNTGGTNMTFGGSSSVGGGGAGSALAGAAGTGHASGGQGGTSFNNTGAQAGGAGTSGYVVITEICNQ